MSVQEQVQVTPVTSDAAPVEATLQEAAPDATPPVPTEATESPPATEEAPPETPKAWATIDGVDYADDYEAFESDKFAPHRERDQRRIEEKLQQTYETRLQSVKTEFESSQVNDTLKGFIGRLAQQIDDGSAEVADKTFDKMLAFAERWEPQYIAEKEQVGELKAAGAIYREMLDLTPNRRARDEFEDFATKAWAKDGRDAWPNIIKQHLKISSSENVKAEYERGVKDGKAAAEAESTAASRNGQGPDNTRASGGKSPNSLADAERRYNLPMGHPEKLSHEDFKAIRTQYGVKS